MKVYLVLTRDEVNQKIPYGVICEARYGCRWDTGRRRRAWMEQFTQEERVVASRLFRRAHEWMLTRGGPDEVKMTIKTFALWLKLGEFCASI